MNCFCGMVDQQKIFSLIYSWDHCRRFSSLRISERPQPGSEPAQNMSSGFVEWICAAVITTTPWCQNTLLEYYFWICSSLGVAHLLSLPQPQFYISSLPRTLLENIEQDITFFKYQSVALAPACKAQLIVLLIHIRERQERLIYVWSNITISSFHKNYPY